MKTIRLALILAAMFLMSNAFALDQLDGQAWPKVAAAEATHDCLVIVIDGSGSMDGEMNNGQGGEVKKMKAAKEALKNVIDQIPSTTHVGVLLFNGSLDWLTQISPLNKNELKAAIDKIEPGGGTPLGQSIKMSADALLDARTTQHNYGTYQLLVVTDGEAGDSDLMEAYAPEIVKRGIQLDVIGVNMPGKHTLATMAHRYWGANDTVSLNSALKTAVQAETQGGAAAEADYELLKGLPDDVAKNWLASVTNMDLANWHIGEQKPEPPAAAGTAQANAAQENQPTPAKPEDKDGIPMILIVFGGIVLAFAVGGFIKSALDGC